MLSQIRTSCSGLQAYRWGFQSLTLDHEMLKVGKISVTECRGVLPDGSPFVLSDGQELVLDVNEDARDTTIYLALPMAGTNLNEFSADENDKHIQCQIRSHNIRDNTDHDNDPAEVKVGQPRFQLLSAEEELDAFQTLAIAQVIQVGADRNVILNEDFIPATLDTNQQTMLKGFATELEGMLHQRAESIAGRVSGTGKSSTEISDFLLLQTINRIEPEIHHLLTLPDLHPETLYRFMLQVAGELATFTRKARRPVAFVDYKHDDLFATFIDVMQQLRESLSAVLESAATQIDLSAPNQYGISTASVGNRDMLQKAMFVLAIKADVPDDRLRQSLPGQMKIGAVEKIAQLINKSLPGVAISALPAAPRQIPFHAGTTYFQLDTTSPAWADIIQSGGIALHVAGQFPGLDITFWAVRQ